MPENDVPLLPPGIVSAAANPQIGPGKKRWWHSDEVDKGPDAKLRLRANIWTSIWLFIWRELLPASAIIFAIVLGASWKMFDFRDTSVLGFGVDVDAQLAVVGFLNKILDMFVQASLSHTASIFLTVWMALGSRFSGVRLIDYELKDELTQPWTCISNFRRRCSTDGWKGLGFWGVIRFLACLAVSICVLLSALAINTVAIPKQRWYPDGSTGGWRLTDAVRRSLTITTPRMTLHGLDWMNYWGVAWNLVGSSAISWDAEWATTAASTYTLLSGLPNAYTSTPTGWLPIDNEVDGLVTGINTVINGTTVQTISVQNSRLRDIFDDLRENGPESFYRSSSGWEAYLNVTVPMLTTSCVPGLTMNESTSDGAIPVNGPPDSSPTESTIIIPIGAVPSLNFTGATCAMTLRQVLFPVHNWIVSMAEIDVSINNYGKNMNVAPVLLAPSIGDRASAQALADQLNTILGRVNGLLQAGLVQHMVYISRRLCFLNPGFSPINDTAGITPVIAAISQHLLTIGAWNMTISSDPNEKTISYPVRWQVYGSGPRLPWEWAAVIILAVILIALLAGGIFSLIWQIEPGPWLDVGSMMLAANESEKMDSVTGSIAGAASQRAEKARYYMRVSQYGRVSLVDGTKDTHKLEEDETYLNEGHTILARRSIDWDIFGRFMNKTKAFFVFPKTRQTPWWRRKEP